MRNDVLTDVQTCIKPITIEKLRYIKGEQKAAACQPR